MVYNDYIICNKMDFSEKISNTIEGLLNFTTKIFIKLELGVWKCVHSACNSNVWVLNILIKMYANCGIIHKAQELFDNGN